MSNGTIINKYGGYGIRYRVTAEAGALFKVTAKKVDSSNESSATEAVGASVVQQ